MANDATTAPTHTQRLATWPLWLLALPAGVAIWSGWVGLGEMTGFGPVTLLPGISEFQINTAVTLPIGMEAYAAYALRAWLSGQLPTKAERFARVSAIGALTLGAAGQAFYHLLASSGIDKAPWPLTVFVSVLPVLVLGMGAALAHLINTTEDDSPAPAQTEDRESLIESVTESERVRESAAGLTALEGDKPTENIPAFIPATTPAAVSTEHEPEATNGVHVNGTAIPPRQRTIAYAAVEPTPSPRPVVTRHQDEAADIREKVKLVACPTCGVAAKRVCRSPGGDRYKKLHVERWRAFGLTPPERTATTAAFVQAEDPWEQESEPVAAAHT